MRLIKYDYKNPMDELIKNFLENQAIDDSKECNIPKANILEKDEQYEIEVAAPGLKKKDIQISVEDDVLTIKSEENKDEEVEFTMKEFDRGNIERSFYLPEEINQEDISASFENGILTIALPKKEEAKAGKKDIAIS